MKILEVLNSSTKALTGKNIEDARLNVELILCHVLNCDRVKLYLDFEKPLNDDELKQIRSMLQRRLMHEPLQYILGETEFFGYRIITRAGALIPRPETEHIVEVLLKDIHDKKLNDIRILEVGSGTGCLSIAISKELTKLSIIHKIVGIDVSDEAIKLSNENKSLNEIPDENLVYVKKNILVMENISPPINYLVSNPPYINKRDYDNLDIGIRSFEPGIALTDGLDGLTFFRKFIELYIASEKKFTCISEIAYDQYMKLTSLLFDNKIAEHEFYDDLSGIKRVLKFQ